MGGEFMNTTYFRIYFGNTYAMVKLHGLVSRIEGDGHPTIDTDLDTHFFRIPIVGYCKYCKS